MNIIYLTTNGDTITNLALPLIIEENICGITQMWGRVISDYLGPLYLCSDICEESRVGSVMLPVLCRINRHQGGIVNSNVYNVNWLNVKRKCVQNIRLYICTDKGTIITLRDKRLHCTLQIKNL